MLRYHVSADGMSRVCKAKSQETCRALGADGEPAPHGEFANAQDAQTYAEKVSEERYGQKTLASTASSKATGFGSKDNEFLFSGNTMFDNQGNEVGELSRASEDELQDYANGEPIALADGEVFTTETYDPSLEAVAYTRQSGKLYRVLASSSSGKLKVDKKSEVAGFSVANNEFLFSGNTMFDRRGNQVGELSRARESELQDYATSADGPITLENGEIFETNTYDPKLEAVGYTRQGGKLYRIFASLAKSLARR